MGLIADVLEFARAMSGDAHVSEVKVDPGGGDTGLPHSYQPIGYDGSPMPGDLCLLVPGPEKGTWEVAGFIDPNNAGTAEAGEVRLYARDGDGGVAATIRIRNNGEVHLGADIAEELIARADRVEASLNALGEKFNSHLHATSATAGVSTTPGTISPPTSDTAVLPPGTPLKQNTDHIVGCDRVYGI